MGLSTLDVEVGTPARPEVTRSIKFLIDSGAVFSVVPRKILDELSIRPVGRQKFRLANGDHISREKGIAMFRYGDRVGGADVIFGEENDSNLIGATTLEALGLALDPLQRELRELPMILGGFPTAPDTPPR
jgi:predicted aspartyl protease